MSNVFVSHASEDIQRGNLITVLDWMSGGELPVNLLWPRTPTLPARIRVVVDELLGAPLRFVDLALARRAVEKSVRQRTAELRGRGRGPS